MNLDGNTEHFKMKIYTKLQILSELINICLADAESLFTIN